MRKHDICQAPLSEEVHHRGTRPVFLLGNKSGCVEPQHQVQLVKRHLQLPNANVTAVGGIGDIRVELKVRIDLEVGERSAIQEGERVGTC